MSIRIKIKERWKLIAFLLILLGLGIYIKLRPHGVEVLPVKIEKRKVVKTITASGKVLANKESDLAFGTSGIISNIYVSEGDFVTKGTLLASLNNAVQRANVSAARDARDIALRDRDIYIENYSTNVNAVGGRDEYNLNIRRLNEIVSKAENAYESALHTLDLTYIYAPYDGVVSDIYVEVGEGTLGASTKIIHFIDTSSFYFQADVDSEDLSKLKQGMSATIYLDSAKDNALQATVTKLPLYHVTSGANVNVPVDLTFDDTKNSKGIILSGITGDVRIEAESTPNKVNTLFYDDIQYDAEDKPYVWVIKNGYIIKQYIKIGLEGDLYVELKEPITLPVVKSASSKVKLEEGMRARLISL